MKDLLRITIRDEETTQIKFDMNGVEEAKILVGSMLSLMEEDKNFHTLMSAALEAYEQRKKKPVQNNKPVS